ncbi:hypothetical protein GCM10010306_099250 [Streptomyces umbrinus]|nr:hypothetical protein GCM10010306_099250 [Streptomyces umbrinus]
MLPSAKVTGFAVTTARDPNATPRPESSTAMPKRERDDDTAPFLELRIGGFRLTLQRPPVRFLAAVSALACSGFTAWWTGTR